MQDVYRSDLGLKVARARYSRRLEWNQMVLEEYERMIGFDEMNPNAIYHHK